MIIRTIGRIHPPTSTDFCYLLDPLLADYREADITENGN